MKTLKEARSDLAAEWASHAPSSPTEIAAFYRDARGVRDDLEAWHALPVRQARTAQIAQVAKQIRAAHAVDVGAGIGHDARALREAGVEVTVVEPNRELAADLRRDFIVSTDVADAPIENADLVLLIDVLEHIPDPGVFLADLAARMRVGGAKPGAVLIESTSSHDVGTPLHLIENRTFRPGRVLEHYGFENIAAIGGVRIWQRSRAARPATASALILCAYRALAIPTFLSVESLRGRSDAKHAWRVMTKTGDALVSRARSVIATRWLLETDDDVFLMVDDDITFLPEVAEQVVAKVHEGLDIVAAAYPIRSGAHLAIYGLQAKGEEEIGFGPDEPPLEIRWAGTGFLACHRRVLEVLARQLPFCHEDQPWGFYPFFMPMLVEMPTSEVYLSEDWAFCERARAAGFHVWLDRAARIGHLATVELNVGNMHAVQKAIASGFDEN